MDVTDIQKTEKEKSSLEQQIEFVLGATKTGIDIINAEYNVRYVDPAWVKIYGNFTDRKCYEYFMGRDEPCLNCGMQKSLKTKTVAVTEKVLVKENNRLIQVISKPFQNEQGEWLVAEVNVDITERKKLEQQLLQSQKMEAISQLAGGIAHDFNNILTAIIGFSNLLQMEIGKDSPLQNNIVPILSAAQRASSLTHALLAFSRKQIMNPKPLNLNQTIKGIERLLSRIIREDIELSINLTDKDLIVMANANQIEQVLMNLATNARDAMPEGGKLTISTDSMQIDDQYIAAHGYGKPGIYAVILLQDTGYGMDIKTQERIFEPFFTTKQVGKVIGLGLAMVYEIIKQHEGYINVYSEPGKGTTFKIYLPLIQTVIEDTKQESLTLIQGGKETILVAEDDVQVRSFIKKLLEKYGYKVVSAIDGDDALKLFYLHREEIQLVILDSIMPKKNGREVYDEVKKIRPNMKAIFISGYVSDLVQEKDNGENGLNFIPKPISPNEFLTKIYKNLHNS